MNKEKINQESAAAMAALLFFCLMLSFQQALGSSEKMTSSGVRPRCAQSADAQSIVTFGKAHTILVGDQVAVIPGGIAETQGAVQQDLARSGFEQVCAPDYFRDSHFRVVGRRRPAGSSELRRDARRQSLRNRHRPYSVVDRD